MYQSNIIKFFLSVIKPYKYWYLLIFQAPIIGSLFNPVNNYAIKLIVDKANLYNSLTINAIILPIILYCSASIILEIVWRLANFADYKISPKVEAEIINKAYFMIFSHKYEFFQNNLSGKLASKIISLKDSFVRVLDLLRFGIVWQSCGIFVVLIMMFFVNIKLGLGVLIWLLIFMPLMFFLKKKGLIYSQNSTNKKQKISGFINDNIANIATVLFFATKKREELNLSVLSQDFITTEQKRLKFIFINHFMLGFVYSALSISVLFTLINLKIKNLISTGDLVMVIGLTFSMIESSWSLLNNLDDLVNEAGKIKESFSIFQQDFSVTDIDNSNVLSVKNPKIEFQNLKYSYQEGNLIFDNFNLKIEAGEKIGLVGVSGSGKSTLIKLLLRFFELNSGKIVIDNFDITKVSLESLRGSISIIPQETNLFHRSIAENIGYGKLSANQEDIENAAKMAKIHDFIMSLPQKYNTLVGERGVKLSGGQRQRIAIARAFLKNSSILILDEATSSLDTETEIEIQQSINAMLDNKTTTVIAIAHRLSTIKHLDRILVLEKGKIIEDGNFDNLLKIENGKFKKLWECQFNGMVF